MTQGERSVSGKVKGKRKTESVVWLGLKNQRKPKTSIGGEEGPFVFASAVQTPNQKARGIPDCHANRRLNRETSQAWAEGTDQKKKGLETQKEEDKKKKGLRRMGSLALPDRFLNLGMNVKAVRTAGLSKRTQC